MQVKCIVTLEDAIIFAEDLHRGQRDKAGEPYIFHPLRVALRVHTERERLAAVLHDVVEDTGVTLVEYRGGLYLLAHSEQGGKILCFAVERIGDVDRLDERFVYPSGYSPAKYTEGTFGIMDGEETRVETPHPE